MTNEPKKILKFEGDSYIDIGLSYSQWVGKNTLINGNPALEYPRSPGDSQFLFISGDVNSVEQMRRPKQVLIHYKAREVFSDIKKSEISVDEYESMDDDHRYAVYEPVYRMDEQENEHVDFDVFDLDVEPKSFPSGVMVSVPDFLKQFKSCWWTLPCHMSSDEVFLRIVSAVSLWLSENNNSGLFKVTHYENTKLFHVDLSMDIVGVEKSVTQRIINFYNSKNNSPRAPQINGDNLDDLNKNLDSFISEQIAKLEAVKSPKVCPCCERKLPPKFGKPIFTPSLNRRR